MKTEKQRGKRRMVYARLSTSEKWNALATDTARLLYVMLLIHTDDMGHMDAAASVVKMVCVPGLDWTINQITELIANIVSVGLATIYEINGHKYLEISDFDEYQKFNRERSPLYPLPFRAVDSSKSEVLEPKDKVSKGKESKGKESIGKEQFGDSVLLTNEEYRKLASQYTEPAARRMIEILDNYKGSSGKNYKSDYKAILNWVVKRYAEEQNAEKPKVVIHQQPSVDAPYHKPYKRPDWMKEDK